MASQEAQEDQIHLFSQKKRASLDKLTDDEKLERRKERLIGRWVKGVLIRNRQNFAVKWNDCQFDNVYVSQRSVALSLGPRPARGIVAVVRCQIKTMGPTSAPWYLQHPYTDKLDLVTRYLRRRRASRRWMHSGMTWQTGTPFTNSPSYSNASTLPPSKRPSPEGSRRASMVDLENIPVGSKVVSRRGSALFIEQGKRWEYKPPVSGPQQLPTGWTMRAVRYGGATYFVPSPPRSQRQSRYSRQRSGRKSGGRGGRRSAGRGGTRRSTGRKPRPKRKKPKSRRPSEEDRLKAEKLIKLIEEQEKRESLREASQKSSRKQSAKKRKRRKKSGEKPKKPSASAQPKQRGKKGKGKKSKSQRQSKLQREAKVKRGVRKVEA